MNQWFLKLLGRNSSIVIHLVFCHLSHFPQFLKKKLAIEVLKYNILGLLSNLEKEI